MRTRRRLHSIASACILTLSGFFVGLYFGAQGCARDATLPLVKTSMAPLQVMKTLASPALPSHEAALNGRLTSLADSLSTLQEEMRGWTSETKGLAAALRASSAATNAARAPTASSSEPHVAAPSPAPPVAPLPVVDSMPPAAALASAVPPPPAAAAAEDAHGRVVRISTTSTIPFDIIVRTAFSSNTVSDLMRASSGYAPVESALVSAILRRRCGASSPPPLVLDVGANLGYFSLLAAAHGCRVRAFEPSPGLAEIVRASVALNGFGELVTVVNAGVGAAPGTMRFAAAADPSISRVVADEPATAHLPLLPIVALADEIDEDVLLVKMDTEGFEPYALQGLLPACAAHRIEHIVVEIKQGGADLAIERLWACIDASAKHAGLAPPSRGAWFHEHYFPELIRAFAAVGLTDATRHGYLERLQSPYAIESQPEEAWFSLVDPVWEEGVAVAPAPRMRRILRATSGDDAAEAAA